MNPSEKCGLIDQLAEEFAARFRRGERPTYQEYVDRYPELADEIRGLFPALVEMERVEVASDAAGPAFRLPRQIGDYRIIREVGRGGMGIVYEAEQQSLGRRVALKVMPGRNANDTTTRERFRREARTAAQLHHTNIVPVFEVGQERETTYYAMQFIQGQGLDQVIVELCRLRSQSARETDRPSQTPVQVIVAAAATHQLAASMLTETFSVEVTTTPGETSRQTPISPAPRNNVTSYAAALPGHTDRSTVQTSHGHYFRSVARIGEQAAAALTYAHERGIVHRDIKPSNLLLDTAGTVWITDFGLAKTDDDGLTKSGDVLGTFRYMAPERFSGPGDARGDIYSLGLTLYELLLLKPAFGSPDRLQLIEQVKQAQIVRPRSIDPRIPRDLETIVLKATDREPRRRYQTAKQLSEDLRRFLAGEPIEARRTGELERMGLWCRRNPLIAAMIGAVAVLLLVLAVGASLSALWLRDERDRAVTNEGRAVKAEKAASAAKSEALAKLWDSSLVAARAGRMSRSPGQRFGSLRAIEQALSMPVPPGRSKDELRTEAIASLVIPDLEVSKEWPGWPTGSRGFAIDGEFNRYARGDANGNVSVRRIADDKELFRLPGVGPATDTYEAIGFSHDGRYLNQNSEGKERIWRLDVDPPTRVVPDDCSKSAFSPDSRQVAAVFPDGAMRFYELPSGRPTREFRIPGFKPYRLVWNPRRALLAACDHSEVRIINVDTGRVEWILPIMPEGISFCDWHPEGQLIAVVGRFESLLRITLWDTVARRQVMSPFEALKSAGHFVTFDRTGDRLITTDWTHNWRLWDRRTARQLLMQPAGGNGIWFSQDDRSVGLDANGKNLRLYHFASGAELCALIHRGSDPSGGFNSSSGFINAHEYCPLDPEGRLIAIFASDGIAVVDVVCGEEVAFVPLPGSAPFGIDGSGALLTHGPAGLLRWPLTVARDGKRSYGPPLKLAPAMSGYGQTPATSANGRVWAFPRGGNGAIAVFPSEGRQFPLVHERENDVRCCAVSPDGSWIATGSHNVLDGPGAKIWNARTGQWVRDLPVGEYCNVAFSPGGNWLVTTAGGTRLWSVGTWRPAAFSDASDVAAFTADDSLVALRDVPGVIRLVVPETGRELARLTAPDAARLSPLCFTRDGRRLVCGDIDSGSLLIFDLGLIREELAPMHLDWDAPPIAMAKQPRPDAVDVSFINETDPGAIQLKQSEVNRQIVEVASDPFNAAKRLELGIRLCDFGDRENGDQQMRFALALKSNLPEARSYRSQFALGTCGNWHTQHERWARAAADYVLVSEIEPDVSERALQATALLLSAGDHAGYRESCQRMLERFRNTTNPNTAERTAKACLISDELKDELAEAARLAEFAARKGATSGDHLWFELTAGIAEYRQELYSAASRRLAKNRDATQGIEVLHEVTCLFEAMALIKTGRAADAEQIIKAIAPVVNNRFGHKPDDFAFNWHDWLIARLALQEAQRLLDDASKSAE